MIIPINLRDASFVMGSLRPLDRLEVSCLHEPWHPVDTAYVCRQSTYGYTAFREGVPTAIFGAHHMNATTVSAWMLGTGDTRRVVPAITRFVMGPLRRQLVADGYRWAEARSIEGHADAHRWIEHMGGEPVADLPSYGKDGENFILFRGPLDV